MARKSLGDLRLKVGGLFSGIGGLELGMERAGMSVEWHCEVDPICQSILKNRMPNVILHEDVRRKIEFEPVDVLVGGFPCQPVSNVGLRLGEDDPRWLWPHFLRVIRQIQPEWIVIENVQSLRTRGLGTVLAGLAESGYDAEWDCLPAASVGAPHRRDRIFIVAYPACKLGSSEARIFREPSGLEHAFYEGCDPRSRRITRIDSRKVAIAPPIVQGYGWWGSEPRVARMVYGIPFGVDRSMRLGNAVVPQIAEWIGRRIIDAHSN